MSSIDVVIPCYRYGRYLRECVQSVLLQAVENLHILIIDDESPDETPEVGAALAREDSRVTYRRHSTNAGHIATYNEGIEWASADYMLLLSADDYLLPNALNRAVSMMNAHPELGFCFGDALILTDGEVSGAMKVEMYRKRSTSSIMFSGPEFIDLCIRQGATNFFIVPTPTAVVRTALQKRLGGYRKDLPHCGDLEMWLRFAAHSGAGYLKVSQAVYRRHVDNMSSEYGNDNIMRDLRQRKAAIDVFRDTCCSQLSNINELHARLLGSLGREAVSMASTAFNMNKMILSREICEFARDIYPNIRRTMVWNMLAVKRRLGHRVSLALLPAVATIRRIVLRSRGY